MISFHSFGIKRQLSNLLIKTRAWRTKRDFSHSKNGNAIAILLNGFRSLIIFGSISPITMFSRRRPLKPSRPRLTLKPFGAQGASFRVEKETKTGLFGNDASQLFLRVWIKQPAGPCQFACRSLGKHAAPVRHCPPQTVCASLQHLRKEHKEGRDGDIVYFSGCA